MTIICFCVNAQTAFITNSGSNTVYVVSVTTNTVSDTIPVGIYPAGLCVSPDGSKIYVANWGSNTISIISCATKTIIHRFSREYTDRKITNKMPLEKQVFYF